MATMHQWRLCVYSVAKCCCPVWSRLVTRNLLARPTVVALSLQFLRHELTGPGSNPGHLHNCLGACKPPSKPPEQANQQTTQDICISAGRVTDKLVSSVSKNVNDSGIPWSQIKYQSIQSFKNYIFSIRTNLVLNTFLVIGTQNGRHTFSSLDRYSTLLNNNLAGLGYVGYHTCHRLNIGQVSRSALLNTLQNHQIYTGDASKTLEISSTAGVL